MYTERGRWTLDFDRQPAAGDVPPRLRRRPRPRRGDDRPARPGVKVDLDRGLGAVADHGLRAGHALGPGCTYSGMQVSSDGSEHRYRPAAAAAPGLPGRAGQRLVRPRGDAARGDAADPAGPERRRRRDSSPARTWPASPSRARPARSPCKVDPMMDGEVIPTAPGAGRDGHPPALRRRPPERARRARQRQSIRPRCPPTRSP